MKHLRKLMLLFLALIVGAVPLLSGSKVAADPLGNVTTYSVVGAGEWVAEASDGTLWATNTAGQNGVVRISKSGASTVYNTTPYSRSFSAVATDSSGNVWFDSSSRVGWPTPQGTIATFDKPLSLRAAPHGITTGPDGNVWFAQGDGNLATSRVGRMTPAGSLVSSYSMGGNPWWLVSDLASNAVWYSLRPIGSSGPNKIGKFEMNGTQTEFDVPSTFGLNIFHMIMGPDGNIWFSSGAGKIGKMTPTGDFTVYDLGYTTTDGLFRLTTGLDGYIWATRKNKTLVRISTDGSVSLPYTLFPPSTPYATVSGGLVGGHDGNIWVLGDNPKQILKVGTGYTDNDEDGLEYVQETAQGTLDNDVDTDDDGLSDYIESTIYPVRDQAFCNGSATLCEYPDPIAKDLYIENDWMVKSGVGGYSMQLTSAQVSSLQAAFAGKNITLHVDTGQLDGGTQIPYTSEIHFAPQAGVTDFYDYKLGGDGLTASMSAVRKDIFHYLLTGEKYSENLTSTGASYAGDDDFFVSYGLLKDSFSGSALDTALSGTVMHELGHGLCLTGENGGSPAYSGQPASCRFAGVDAFAGLDYASVMNYDNQSMMVDYSEGLNGAPDDHDDWAAIRLHDFTKSTAGDIAHGVSVKNPTFKHREYKKRNSKNERPIIGPNISKLKATRH